ncbi:hypothetical protein J0S82_008644, partial [Galemys pyrenaicus]
CIYERKNNGTCIINLQRTWEKLLLVSLAMAALKTWLKSVLCPPGHWPTTYAEASSVYLPPIAQTLLCNRGLMWWALPRNGCMCGTIPVPM